MRDSLHAIFALCCVVLLASFASAETRQITFQGLTGSDGRPEVQAKFPGAKPENICSLLHPSNEKVIGKGDDALECMGLKVASYDVAGIKFDLSFSFKANTHKLATVYLIYWWAFPSQSTRPERLSKSQIRIGYERLRSILIANHGPPLSDPICTRNESDPFLRYCDEWQGMPEANWPDASLGTIDLEALAGKANKDEDSYYGSYAISYVLTESARGL